MVGRERRGGRQRRAGRAGENHRSTGLDARWHSRYPGGLRKGEAASAVPRLR